MTTRSYRWLAVLLFIGGMICLALTATMNFLQGEALGVTLAGKLVNSISSVVVDVVGLLFMGLAAGACLAAQRWIPSVVFSVIVILSAGWSIQSMIGFQAGERFAAADNFNRTIDRHARADKLTEDNANWFTRMTSRVGRSARRDYIAAASESVKELRTVKVEARVDPAAGTKAIAAATNRDVETVAIGQISYLSLLLILLKAVCFPAAGYFWAPLAVKQAGSDGSNQKNSGGSDGSSGSGKTEPRSKLKVVQGEPVRTMQAQPSYKPSSVGLRVSTDAPKGKLTYEQFLHDLHEDMAHGDLASSTRAIAARTGWSQSSVVRHARRLSDKATRHTRRFAGNGGGFHVSAMG